MIVRLYSGNDGQSHFDDLNLPTSEVEPVTIKPGADLTFRRADDGQLIGAVRQEIHADDHTHEARTGNEGWHNAPRRQYVIVLSNHMEVRVGDGTVRRLGPGDVMLAEDFTGQGHISRAVGSPLVWVTVPLSE